LSTATVRPCVCPNSTGFDAEAARQYGRIRTALKRAGTPIGGNELLIAAHALSLGVMLVTNNLREFSRVPGLRVEQWS
jgi:tRNA(fMet)-specific endonuclease VapC